MAQASSAALAANSVPPNELDWALDHVRKGGILYVPSVTRTILIDKKCLLRFEKAGEWLLKADGDGYRIRQGRGSVYCYAGLLRYR